MEVKIRPHIHTQSYLAGGPLVQADVWSWAVILRSFRGGLMQDQVSPSISDACVEWMDSFRWHVPSLDTGHFTGPPTLQIFTWHVSVGGGPSKETCIHTFTLMDFLAYRYTHQGFTDLCFESWYGWCLGWSCQKQDNIQYFYFDHFHTQKIVTLWML